MRCYDQGDFYEYPQYKTYKMLTSISRSQTTLCSEANQPKENLQQNDNNIN